MSRPTRRKGWRVGCGRRTRGLGGLLALLLPLTVAGCYRGDVREKQPPPGYAGGKCIAGAEPYCEDGSLCHQDAICYDFEDPCRGFFCGGSDRGMCSVSPENLPTCFCNNGYENDTFAYYCCPDPTVGNLEIDPVCNGSGAASSDTAGFPEATASGP